MRITIIDLQIEDIMWFAIDKNGCVIEFTTGGRADVPEFVCRSKEETELLEEFFMNLPVGFSNAELLIDRDGSPLATDSEALAKKGIFCFDACSEFDYEYMYGYYKIAYPDKTLHLLDLPQNIRNIMADHIIDVDVSETDRITVKHAY